MSKKSEKDRLKQRRNFFFSQTETDIANNSSALCEGKQFFESVKELELREKLVEDKYLSNSCNFFFRTKN